jgi:hypothetical protein
MAVGDWLPVNQATALLGVSQRTLYRRIEAGQYRIRHVDGRTQVWVDGAMAAVPAMADGMAAPTADVTDAADSAVPPASAMADALARAVDTLEHLLEEDRRRAEAAEQRAGAAEQAAAMWQERARNLEAELARALALPAHEEPEPPRRRWWPWRKGDQPSTAPSR